MEWQSSQCHFTWDIVHLPVSFPGCTRVCSHPTGNVLVLSWHADHRAVPCRAVPCRAEPSRAVPCRAEPCRAVPCRAVPSRAVPFHHLHHFHHFHHPPSSTFVTASDPHWASYRRRHLLTPNHLHICKRTCSHLAGQKRRRRRPGPSPGPDPGPGPPRFGPSRFGPPRSGKVRNRPGIGTDKNSLLHPSAMPDAVRGVGTIPATPNGHTGAAIVELT